MLIALLKHHLFLQEVTSIQALSMEEVLVLEAIHIVYRAQDE
jgi:hypothetical protein